MHRNYRGDVVTITDETGNLAAEYMYDLWGKPITKNVIGLPHDQPIRYASYYYDEDLKLYYLMARYYHPEHAVFLSVDPILDSDESVEMANGYSYVVNNPVTRIGPDGLMWQNDKLGASNGARGSSSNFSMGSSSSIKNVYNSIKVVPQYPRGFRNASHSATKHEIKDKSILAELRKIESGSWNKVYKDGYSNQGKKISIHYFQSRSGKVFNVKVKNGWSNK